ATITAATPMITPSIVKNDLSLFAVRPRRAMVMLTMSLPVYQHSELRLNWKLTIVNFQLSISDWLCDYRRAPPPPLPPPLVPERNPPIRCWPNGLLVVLGAGSIFWVMTTSPAFRPSLISIRSLPSRPTSTGRLMTVTSTSVLGSGAVASGALYGVPPFAI